MEDQIKLFKVRCQNMHISVTGAPNGNCFVLATNPDEAYQKLKKYLDENNYGFYSSRELLDVTLIADSSKHPMCGMKIHL